jgi:signal peptidase II
MRWLAVTAVAAFVVDQASKYAVVFGLELWRRGGIEIFPPLLNFRYGENRGINFGLFDGESDSSRWVLIGLALVICGIVHWWVRRHDLTPLGFASAGLLIGGALANVFDRSVYGYVLDFLNMSCCGIYNPFVFNLADVFIFAGAIGLVFLAPDTGVQRQKGK